MVKLPRLNPLCVICRLLRVAVPRLENLGEVAVALAIVRIVALPGVITMLLAVSVNASPIVRLNVPTEIFSAPPPLPKSKLALRLLRLDVKAVEPGNNTTLAALTVTVPLNVPVELV